MMAARTWSEALDNGRVARIWIESLGKDYRFHTPDNAYLKKNMWMASNGFFKELTDELSP